MYFIVRHKVPVEGMNTPVLSDKDLKKETLVQWVAVWAYAHVCLIGV
jgi:hypothetical protein